MGYLMPASGSSLGSGGSIVGSTKAAVWLSLTAATNTTASVLIGDDSSNSTAGRQIGRLTAAACTTTPLHGPFISVCGLYLYGLTGGSVNAWVRMTSR